MLVMLLIDFCGSCASKYLWFWCKFCRWNFLKGFRLLWLVCWFFKNLLKYRRHSVVRGIAWRFDPLPTYNIILECRKQSITSHLIIIHSPSITIFSSRLLNHRFQLFFPTSKDFKLFVYIFMSSLLSLLAFITHFKF